MTHLYSPIVRFHGKTITARSLLNEKERFAAQWPTRDYRYRPSSLRVSCGDSTCRVQGVFDYKAIGRERGRRANGSGFHELVIDRGLGAPTIIAENSGRIVRELGGSRPAMFAPRTSPPRAAAPAATPEVLEACKQSLEDAANPYKPTEVEAIEAGKAQRTSGGLTTVPLRARVVYRTGKVNQVREARVNCRLDKRGVVVALE